MSDPEYLPPWHKDLENKNNASEQKNTTVPKYLIWVVIFVGVLILLFAGLGLTMYFSNQSYAKKVASLGDTTPFDVKFVEVGSTSFVIEWKTKTPTIGFIKYGITDTALDYIGQASENPGGTKTEHKVLVDGLDPGQKYYVEIHSNAQAYGEDGLPLSVTTLE